MAETITTEELKRRGGKLVSGEGVLTTEELLSKRVTPETVLRPDIPEWFKAARETAEGIGLGAGDIARIGGPGASAVAGGLGYATAKTVADAAQDLLGYGQPTTRSVGQALTKPLQDIGMGANMAMAGGLVGRAAAKGGGMLAGAGQELLESGTGANWFTELLRRFAGTMPPGVQSMLDVYSKYGIKPLPSDLKPTWTKSLFEMFLDYRPSSGNVMDQVRVGRVQALNRVREKLVAGNSPPGEIERVGLEIRNEMRDLLSDWLKGKNINIDQAVNRALADLGVVQLGKHESGTMVGEMLGAQREAARAALYGNPAEGVKGRWGEFTEKLPQRGNSPIPESPLEATAEKILKEQLDSKYPSQPVVNLVSRWVKKGAGKAEKAFMEEMNITPEKLKLNPWLQDELNAIKGGEGAQETWNGLQISERNMWNNQSVDARTKERLSKAIKETQAAYLKAVEGEGGALQTEFNSLNVDTTRFHDVYDKDVMRIMNASPNKLVDRVIAGGTQTFREMQLADPSGGVESIVKNQLFDRLIENSKKAGHLYPRKLETQLQNVRGFLKEIATPDQITILENLAKYTQTIEDTFQKSDVRSFVQNLAQAKVGNIVGDLWRPNNEDMVRVAKQILPSHMMEEVKKLGLERMLELSYTSNYMPVTSAKNVRAHLSTLWEMLNSNQTDRAKYSSILDFVNVPSTWVKVEKLAQEAQRTGPVLLGHFIWERIVTHPSRIIQTVGQQLWIPRLMANIYTSDTALTLYKQALKEYPSGQAVKIFAQSMAAVGRTPFEAMMKAAAQPPSPQRLENMP